jgi:hypothetical protein
MSMSEYLDLLLPIRLSTIFVGKVVSFLSQRIDPHQAG